MWSEESEFNWKDLCDLLCLCEHHGGITEQWHVTDIKAGPTFTALNRRIHLACRHQNQCLSTSFSLISYSTNYIRLKKHEKHIASHFWKSYSLTFWATEKSPERTSFSLIWRRTTSDKHPERNIFSSSVLFKHQYCTLLTGKYITARTTSHKCQVDTGVFLLKIKTSKNIQHFTAYWEDKVIQSVQMSPYGHKTTPNEGTVLFHSYISAHMTASLLDSGPVC